MADMINWNRLEPHPRTDDQTAAVAGGLEARVHDPLWLLGRQWQFREFEGDDTGSPVAVRMQYATTHLSRWAPDITGTTSQPWSPADQPLETLIEREAQPSVGLRAAAEAGVHFLAMLGEAGTPNARSAYASAYAFAPLAESDRADTEADRLAIVLATRAIDGVRVAAALAPALMPATGAPALPPIPAIDAGEHDRVLVAAQAWLAWYRTDIAPVSATDMWIPERLEYRFSIAAATPLGVAETVLAAPDYRGEGLEWYDFVHQPNRTIGAAAEDAPLQSWAGLPAPITFRGMPAARWWEFEDASVDFGAVDTAPDDIGRLLVTEFATVFGNDWYIIPVALPIGSLTSLASLVVTDTFGERRLIEPTAKARTAGGPWRMFHISEDAAAAGAKSNIEALFLAPVISSYGDGRPLEEVLFVRDEMADMAWAVERVVQGPSGMPIDRTEQWNRRIADAARAQASAIGAASIPIAPLRYQLATTVPDHWVPLLPVHDGTNRGVRLQRGAMLHFDTGVPVAIEPQGRLLASAADRPLEFYEEEVPREGRRVQRIPMLARWSGGTTVCWVGRRSRVGRGEGSSGLRYDVAERT
ncbi:MAG TPA: hypothetical protein VIJ64_04450 [Candidatus Lustribacter sp.]